MYAPTDEQRQAVDEQRRLLEVVDREECEVIAEVRRAVASRGDDTALRDALRAEDKAFAAAPAVAAAVHDLVPRKKRAWYQLW